MKKQFALLSVLFLFALSFAQAQTTIVTTNTFEAGKDLRAAGRSYTAAKLLPLIGAATGAVVIVVMKDNPDAQLIGSAIGGVSVLMAIYHSFRGDAKLRQAGKKLMLTTTNNGVGVSLRL